MSHGIKTPRWDGATIRAAFTVNPEVAEGSRCMACNEHVGPGKYHECWSLPAQGIEAGTATTAGRGPQDESPVAESDAPQGRSND